MSGNEAEKRAFFEQGLSIPSLFLPHQPAGESEKRFRYFVDKTPIGFEPDEHSDPPVPLFVYADPGSSAVGFETFLARYQLLFACRPRLRMIHATPLECRFASGKIFEAFKENLSGRRRDIVEARVDRFGRYFDLMLKLPRDEQGNALKWALAERSRLRREIDPEDLLPFAEAGGAAKPTGHAESRPPEGLP